MAKNAKVAAESSDSKSAEKKPRGPGPYRGDTKLIKDYLFKKDDPRRGRRPKGVPNTMTKAVKEAVLGAGESIGNMLHECGRQRNDGSR